MNLHGRGIVSENPSVNIVQLASVGSSQLSSKQKTGTLLCCDLGAQKTPPHLFLIFFLLILALAGNSNPAGP